ncbi:MFS transporter [Amycolatopsis sp. H6(2020)]|nr:MFS transporter [Amycolatopsis sp. H6(2020)]
MRRKARSRRDFDRVLRHHDPGGTRSHHRARTSTPAPRRRGGVGRARADRTRPDRGGVGVRRPADPRPRPPPLRCVRRLPGRFADRRVRHAVLGRLIDRYGPRRVMPTVAACFGAILIAATMVSEITGLTAAFIGIRVGGQGALNLVATVTVAIYVHRRRGFAIGVASAIGSAGISLTPLLLENLVSAWGRRTRLAVGGRGRLCAGHPRRAPAPAAKPPPAPMSPDPASPGSALPPVDWTLREALRTGMFWVVTAGVGVCALVATGLNFHQQSLLGERGLTAAEAAATFLPLGDGVPETAVVAVVVIRSNRRPGRRRRPWRPGRSRHRPRSPLRRCRNTSPPSSWWSVRCRNSRWRPAG